MWADEDAVQPGRLAFGFRLEVEPDITHETQEVWAEYSRAEQIGDSTTATGTSSTSRTCRSRRWSWASSHRPGRSSVPEVIVRLQ